MLNSCLQLCKFIFLFPRASRSLPGILITNYYPVNKRNPYVIIQAYKPWPHSLIPFMHICFALTYRNLLTTRLQYQVKLPSTVDMPGCDSHYSSMLRSHVLFPDVQQHEVTQLSQSSEGRAVTPPPSPALLSLTQTLYLSGFHKTSQIYLHTICPQVYSYKTVPPYVIL